MIILIFNKSGSTYFIFYNKLYNPNLTRVMIANNYPNLAEHIA